MKVHLTVPVTRYWTGTKWPMYGSFETACGRQIGAIRSTNRRGRATCKTCRRHSS